MLLKKLKPYPFDEYGYSEIRVIDDTDFACEGDDPFATCHLLLTSKFDVKAITAANFMHDPTSAQKSYNKINVMLEKMGLLGDVKVCHGSPAMVSETEYETSEASDYIVEEAMKDDPRPLFVLVQGAISNVAIAIKENPEIVKRMHIIWIGGQPYPHGGWEFNLSNDVIASRIIMDSGVSLWQVTAKAYSSIRVSFQTLEEEIGGCGEIGRWLLEQLYETNRNMGIQFASRESGPFGNGPEKHCSFANGEQWQLGDCPVTSLMLNAQVNDRVIIGAPYINDDSTYTLRPDNPNKIAVYDNVDSQFMLRDLFAKLRYQYGNK